MKTTLISCAWLALMSCLLPPGVAAQTYTVNSQVFKVDTLYPASGTNGFNAPWEITYGPDDSLWVTEAKGYKVWKINPRNKGSRSILDVSTDKNFTEASISSASISWPQGGLMGLTIHPDFATGKRYVYLAYIYNQVSCSPGSPCYYSTKIVRYDYPNSGVNRYRLANPVTIVSGLPGSNDHNSGRMTIGPGDLKLYYTIGDMGAGQFNNASRINYAQDTNVYEGKILRFNTEPDAGQSGGDEWIPDDNPFPGNAAATAKNAIYSYGHRNAQGVVWGNVGGVWRLYSSEHGDKSDDEINIIQRKGNYGWPRVAGLSTDNNYSNTDAYANNNRLANMTLGREDTFYTNNTARGLFMKEPMKSLFAQPANNIKADGSDIYTWWTIAPSSIDFYGSSYSKVIPGWENSILVPSLKQGLYRINLSASGTSFFGDTVRYMVGNRVRDVAINPHGDTLYFVIDRSGSTSGPTGGFSGVDMATPNPGFILRMVYMNAILSKQPPKPPVSNSVYTKIYPNPTTDFIYVDTKSGLPKPIRYQLLDLTGKMLIEGVAMKDHFQVSLKGIRPGIYLFKMYDNTGAVIKTEKIIIR